MESSTSLLGDAERADGEHHAQGRPQRAWRRTLQRSAVIGTCVFFLNLITLIVVYARFRVTGNAATLWTGSCTTSANTVWGANVLVNSLSTICLAASIFCMQCLSSVSRAEVDKAHARRQCLSIAVPSFRNLRYIATPKLVLWFLLGLSSIPLHLLWNSVVLETVATNEYLAISATESFVDGANWQLDDLMTLLDQSQSTTVYSDYAHQIISTVNRVQTWAQHGKLARLETAACIRTYDTSLHEFQSNLVLVVDSSNASDSSSVLALNYDDFSPYLQRWPYWMAESGIDEPEKLATHWVPLNHSWPSKSFGDQRNAAVKYCLVEEVAELCEVSVVPVFLGVVIICNLIQMVCFVLALQLTKKSQLLVTTGDAIRSFLSDPELHTSGQCLTSGNNAAKGFSAPNPREQSEDPEINNESMWTSDKQIYGKAVPQWQWVLLLFCACIGTITVFVLFGPFGINRRLMDGFPDWETVQYTWTHLIDIGIGQPQANLNFTWWNIPILRAFMLANLPQLFVSFMYLGLNHIITTMLAMVEWTSLACGPAKRPRISGPVKDSKQRSTYFLSIPFRWAVLQMVAFTMLHWLVSKMFFLVRFKAYDMDGSLDEGQSFTTLYHSPLAMLLSVTLLIVLLAIVGIGALKETPSGMPLAGCSSASISAACQSGFGEEVFAEGLALRRPAWGPDDTSPGSDIGHAAFYGGEATPLMKGKPYD